MGNVLRLKKPVIAITGSAGKSTTKEMVASVLATRWRIFKSVDNLNFFTHTRQYAKRIQPRHQAVVLEYGMSGAGHIKQHCLAIEPNYSVITNIGSAHIGAFGGDVRKLARAKSEIIRWMKPTGTVVLNKDDRNTSLIDKGRFHGRTVTVGINNSATYQARSVRYSSAGMTFQVPLHGKTEQFTIPIYGRHHVYNALCAIAISDLLGFSPQQIRVGLRRYRRMQRRTTIHRFARNIVLIDDSYSSNPHAAKAAIDTLAQIGKGTKIAVLGSMRALGSYAGKGHREVGQYIAGKNISRLYTYGVLAKQIGTAAVKAGMPASHVIHFAKQDALHRHLLSHLTANTTILVKGSHAVRLMDTADLLKRRLGGKPLAASRKPAVRKQMTVRSQPLAGKSPSAKSASGRRSVGQRRLSTKSASRHPQKTGVRAITKALRKRK
ncbi:UDP-N-acetylmuramoyl-tripeptide--D-alanyl-D-alanine ligase [Alicyclobacillus curvatus]|nr:UDP-N-acetylmuramoyl-tripeptide--D-alanyl-D-alanine ligase [Alicyclobacillus curvatus]